MPLFDSAGPPAPAGQPSDPGAPLAGGMWAATPREPLLVRMAGRWWYPYELAAGATQLGAVAAGNTARRSPDAESRSNGRPGAEGCVA